MLHLAVHQSNISKGDLQEQARSTVDLSVVIVSWNVRDLLVGCLMALQSVAVRGKLRLEVIVVDNASRDGSAQAAARFPGVKVVRCANNLGYGRANNLGMERATGRHLLVLNPDTVPQSGSLEALVRFADTHPQAGVVAPRLLNPDGTVQLAAFRFPTLIMAVLDLFPLPSIVPGRIRQWLAGATLNGRYPDEPRTSKPFRIDHPLGACMLIRREDYEKVGGFDPHLFMYSEEVDFAMRLHRAGWECWQVPVARVVHLGGQSTKQMPGRMRVELWRSRLYVYSRHKGLLPNLLLRVLLALAQVKDITLTLLPSTSKSKEARQQRRVALRILKVALSR